MAICRHVGHHCVVLRMVEPTGKDPHMLGHACGFTIFLQLAL
jgi:hypothetical protein